MERFLMSSSAAVKAGSHGNLLFHVVLGDESCDLDSVVSSLAMAYFLSRISPGVPENSVVVPVLNVPRSEFRLRADCHFLLNEVGVSLETLVFRDEVDLPCLHGNRRLALTLVDHNVLPSTDSGLEGAVVEVVDHHQLERTISSSCPVAAETVASCATLVTERILTRAPQILDRQLALLLYGAVLVDSVNLREATAKDSHLLGLLESQFPDLPARGALHAALHRAKTDLSGLTTEQILIKDMKTVAGGDLRIAVSTVFTTLDSFLQKKSLQEELCDFCHSRRLSALVTMTISFNNQSDEPVRQLAVYSSSSVCRQQISHALCSSQSPALCLSPVSCPYKDILAYQQGNAHASRQKLLPVLRHFLSDRERRQVHCGTEEEELEDPLDMMISDSGRVSTPDPADELRPRVYSASRHHRRRLLGVEDCGTGEEDCGGGGAVPPTPMNSWVDGCPLDSGFNQEALLEKFSRMGGAEEEPGRAGLWGRGGGGGGMDNGDG